MRRRGTLQIPLHNTHGGGGNNKAADAANKAEADRKKQVAQATAAIDSTGMCLFIAFAILDQPETFQALLDIIGAYAGTDFTADGVTELGKQVLTMERDFNARAGFTKAHDRLPGYFKTEALPPHNVTFGVTDEDLDKVFEW